MSFHAAIFSAEIQMHQIIHHFYFVGKGEVKVTKVSSFKRLQFLSRFSSIEWHVVI